MKEIHKSAPVPILATLTALGLAVATLARPAPAQGLTLNSGDAVTVSAAGTVGTVSGKPVTNATKTYNGGTSYAVQTNGTGAFTLASGGTLNSGQGGYGLYADGSGADAVSGGSIFIGQNGDGVYAAGSGAVTVTGGNIIVGDGGLGLYAGAGGTIDLFSRAGTLFTINGVVTPNGTLTTADFNGTISGTLLDGETLDTTFQNSGTINLNTVTPEPSPPAALGLGALGLAGLTLTARRRSAV